MTPAQKRILAELVAGMLPSGPPTCAELAERCGLRSRAGVWANLKRLEQQGYVRKERGHFVPTGKAHVG